MSNPIKLDLQADNLITDFGMATLTDRNKKGDSRYLTREEKSPQEAYARAAWAFSEGHIQFGQRIYEYASRNWFMFSTPILSNGGTTKGMPISCFLNHVDDSIEGILSHYVENAWMSSMGGGIGGNWSSVRSNGADIATGGESTGATPFIHVVDSLMLAFSQRGTRRGSYAAYMDIGHPEIEEFIHMRKLTGDINRKSPNLHHGVNISDQFIGHLSNDAPWCLTDPHTRKVVKEISPRSLWEQMIGLRAGSSGEPYFHFSDTSNRLMPSSQRELGLSIRQSNLCVAPETVILTDKGYSPIQECGDVSVWNGSEFSPVIVVKTGENQKLLKVKFSDGSELDCTEYHKFYIQEGYNRGTGKNKMKLSIKEALNLKAGDRLQKFITPVIEYGEEMEEPYTQGFFSGDGCTFKGVNHIDLYGEKRLLLSKLTYRSVQKYYDPQDRQRILIDNSYIKFEVPLNCSISSRLQWLAGLMDSDGVLCKNGKTEHVQIASIHKSFLLEVKLMLQTLGVQSKVQLMHAPRFAELPDGKGSTKLFNCKATWRLLISSEATFKLQELGLQTYRLRLTKHKPNRNAEHFVRITEIIDENRVSDTYCFNEPLQHKGIFNGILTGNCSEIILPTNSERTAVCCLSSVNLETYDDWKDDKQFIPDLVRFLDNVLTYFIENAPKQLSKAVYSASRERSIGLGAMGFHAYLQKNTIPFEGPLATGINKRIFTHISDQVDQASKQLGLERGLPPDAYGNLTITDRRNMSTMAIAPNASSSIICGTTSPSIEPYTSNVYMHDTLSGSFKVKNRFLDKRILELGLPYDEVWKDITAHGGSIQHIETFSNWDKKVFRTARELDQRWIIEHAIDRQQIMDQRGGGQAQSVNLFFESNANVQDVHDIHYRAWEGGLKTLYYGRGKSQKRPENLSTAVQRIARPDATDDDCFSCQG